MPISEKATIDKIEIFENGLFIIRRARVILDNDGSELIKVFSREPLEPGQDVTNQPNKIKQLIQIIWTAQVIADYKARQNANQPKP